MEDKKCVSRRSDAELEAVRELIEAENSASPGRALRAAKKVVCLGPHNSATPCKPTTEGLSPEIELLVAARTKQLFKEMVDDVITNAGGPESLAKRRRYRVSVEGARWLREPRVRSRPFLAYDVRVERVQGRGESASVEQIGCVTTRFSKARQLEDVAPLNVGRAPFGAFIFANRFGWIVARRCLWLERVLASVASRDEELLLDILEEQLPL